MPDHWKNESPAKPPVGADTGIAADHERQVKNTTRTAATDDHGVRVETSGLAGPLRRIATSLFAADEVNARDKLETTVPNLRQTTPAAVKHPRWQ